MLQKLVLQMHIFCLDQVHLQIISSLPLLLIPFPFANVDVDFHVSYGSFPSAFTELVNKKEELPVCRHGPIDTIQLLGQNKLFSEAKPLCPYAVALASAIRL